MNLCHSNVLRLRLGVGRRSRRRGPAPETGVPMEVRAWGLASTVAPNSLPSLLGVQDAMLQRGVMGLHSVGPALALRRRGKCGVRGVVVLPNAYVAKQF